jgi:hypothetical protein
LIGVEVERRYKRKFVDVPLPVNVLGFIRCFSFMEHFHWLVVHKFAVLYDTVASYSFSAVSTELNMLSVIGK